VPKAEGCPKAEGAEVFAAAPNAEGPLDAKAPKAPPDFGGAITVVFALPNAELVEEGA